MDEDEDDFIYGGSAQETAPAPAQPQTTPVFEPQPVTPIQPLDVPLPSLEETLPTENDGYNDDDDSNEGEQMMDEEEDGEEDEEESDIEIIVDVGDKGQSSGTSRDFKAQAGNRAASNDATINSLPGTGALPVPSAPHLTTEYTPTPRGEVPTRKPLALPPSYPPSENKADDSSESRSIIPSVPAQDPSTLPPAIAPPSHPPINPSEPGTIEGRSIFEVDMDALAEKPWRRPGSDISDYFNYGFDEISWEAYCYRRRDLGEMANHLKVAVTNFSGLPEDQLAVLPPEVRAMVMSGATSLMSNGALPHGMQQPQMMGVGVNGPGTMMHPHQHAHEMGMMGVMNVGEMQQPQGVMPVQENDGMGGMQPEGFQPGIPGSVAGPAQMMGMGSEYGMQDPSALGMYQQNMDGSGTPSGLGQGPGPVLGPGPGVGPGGPAAGPGQVVTPPAGPSAARGGGAQQGGFRGRPSGSPMGMRGRGGFGRGRGRGGMFVQEGVPPPIPVRPASPLPPGVPTGPRNQNRYKDRDGNAPAVDGLDYGGTQGGNIDSEERGNGRKRRVSPGQEDGLNRQKRR